MSDVPLLMRPYRAIRWGGWSLIGCEFHSCTRIRVHRVPLPFEDQQPQYKFARVQIAEEYDILIAFARVCGWRDEKLLPPFNLRNHRDGHRCSIFSMRKIEFGCCTFAVLRTHQKGAFSTRVDPQKWALMNGSLLACTRSSVWLTLVCDGYFFSLPIKYAGIFAQECTYDCVTC